MEELMRIVQGDEVEWVRGLEHRGGTFHFRNLLEGTPGAIDNFQLSMGRNDKDFVSPRHRHNFDQFRFQLEGDLDFARDGKMAPGMVGYFPEGAAYGPQTSEATAVTIVLQFGGASLSGYLSRHEVRAGMEALRAFGTFEAGVYRRNDGVPGKRNQDGYEAIWAHVNGRDLQYPPPRYPAAIMMDEARFAFLPVAGHPGVCEKLLGAFTERRAEAGFLRLEAGATFSVAGRAIYVACKGKGRVNAAPLRPFTTLFLDYAEHAALTAVETTELIRFGLPDLRDLAARADADVPAEAAE
jgi:hypothetical protein